MKRKLTNSLIAWMQSEPRKPLMLFGARQTGKTTSILEFAHSWYDQVVYIDFYKQPQMKAAFDGGLEPASVIAALEALLRVRIHATNALIVFDEVQECDRAITALKFFCTDAPQYNVIAAGSLLGVHVAREGSFPVGYVDMLTMHPMDFEEFCWALDEEMAFGLARQSFDSFSPCVLHERLMELYKSYLLIGGMPEAVLAYAHGKRLHEVREIQDALRVAYVADMAKYATSVDAAKIIECWESLPSQLAKESGSTKFMWKHVASGAKAERYASAIDWLVASGVVSRCTQISEGISPLKSFENPPSFKIYVSDTGLLSCAYDATPADFEGKDIRSARFRGGMAENYVMQQLTASGLKPYYWGMQSTYEVEFVVKLADGVVPIEVKSGRRVASTSANRFAEKYGCPYIIRVSGKNFGSDDGVKSVPLYAAGLIGEWR